MNHNKSHHVLSAVVILLIAGLLMIPMIGCGKETGPADKEKVVNARCPIMGTKIDSEKVPQSLTREWKGQKIGFCCNSCPGQWDQLSDTERQEKLDAVMDKPGDRKP